jgi:hypothetical protein
MGYFIKSFFKPFAIIFQRTTVIGGGLAILSLTLPPGAFGAAAVAAAELDRIQISYG